jgi:hypothetical protein
MGSQRVVTRKEINQKMKKVDHLFERICTGTTRDVEETISEIRQLLAFVRQLLYHYRRPLNLVTPDGIDETQLLSAEAILTSCIGCLKA